MTDSPGAGPEPRPNLNVEGLLSDSGLGGFQNIFEWARTSLSGSTVEGVAGGGAVRITITGEREIVAVTIDPEVFASGDASTLEELVLAAAADGYVKAEARRSSSIGSLLQQLGVEGVG